ncbi:YkgJ family cysteine cluster protein [Magnetococcus sp. PR-3]|uniref:YkgJ family cysteine cluster protein n=1 Tax=Magnetococcus sp. PR-3 TaxID=3120355 RepID=UPI002FCE4527
MTSETPNMTPFDAPNNRAVEAGNLCKSCGLCCTGSFFSFVNVFVQEQARLTELGIPTYEQGKGEIVFDQPCPRLKESCCSIYDERPKKCQGYNCQLLKSIWMGDISTEEGAALIQQAKSRYLWLIDQARDLDPVHPAQINLRTFLYNFYRKQKKRPLNAKERDFVRSTFDYLCLIRRHFHESSLMGKYAIWLQRLAAIEEEKADEETVLNPQPNLQP